MIQDKFERPLRDLRISVTDRCNFRCPYCMPAEIFGERYRFLTRAQLLSFEEITRLTRIFVRLGVVKVRLTGGEPLARQQVEKLVAMLAEIGGIEDVAMTTNGVLLPSKAALLRDAGLQRMTVSLDSLDDEIFRAMNGNRAGVDEVLKGIESAERAGFSPIKINTVVKRSVNDHTIIDLARYFKARGHIVRFIEYMDVGTLNDWKPEHVVPGQEIVERINAEMPLEPVGSNYHGEVAKRYRYCDGSGEIGLITSVTQPFCGACSRVRLSAEGKLYTCLFTAKGTDLRSPLREGASNEELETLIREIWGGRDDRYSEQRASITGLRDKVEMYHIGG